jgi:hypothetical protein
MRTLSAHWSDSPVVAFHATRQRDLTTLLLRHRGIREETDVRHVVRVKSAPRALLPVEIFRKNVLQRALALKVAKNPKVLQLEGNNAHAPEDGATASRVASP